MGTRFIATQEADFEPIWKEAITSLEERQTLVARGLFGPMRFLRNERAEMLVHQTLADVPRFYLGEPVESNEAILELEQSGFVDLLDRKTNTALMFGGEVTGRISNLPTVAELIKSIVNDAIRILHEVPGSVLKS
jgi:enoyl-[acyl-carrier protein] reductase II